MRWLDGITDAMDVSLSRLHPWLGFSAPHTRRLIPWVPRKCMTDVASLALSSPAETCVGVWGLILRVWVPAHSPN